MQNVFARIATGDRSGDNDVGIAQDRQQSGWCQGLPSVRRSVSRPLSETLGDELILDVGKFRAGCKPEPENPSKAQVPVAVRSALTTPPMPPDVEANVFGEQATLEVV